jgi:hypothetical protein
MWAGGIGLSLLSREYQDTVVAGLAPVSNSDEVPKRGRGLALNMKIRHAVWKFLS